MQAIAGIRSPLSSSVLMADLHAMSAPCHVLPRGMQCTGLHARARPPALQRSLGSHGRLPFPGVATSSSPGFRFPFFPSQTASAPPAAAVPGNGHALGEGPMLGSEGGAAAQTAVTDVASSSNGLANGLTSGSNGHALREQPAAGGETGAPQTAVAESGDGAEGETEGARGRVGRSSIWTREVGKEAAKNRDSPGGYATVRRELQEVDVLSDFIPNLPVYPNPLLKDKYFSPIPGFFAQDTDLVAKEVKVNVNDKHLGDYYRVGGPREQVVFRPGEVKAAIVTCGGLCPGLNAVIREIVLGLRYQYGVTDVVGIRGGYRGFYAENTVELNPKVVSDWHRRGGTMLGTTRGGHDTKKIVDSIEDRGINQVYIIGGDGTQRGALKIHEEIKRRKLKIAVVGIPKTVDNDVAIIDKSFGFETAVEAAQTAIQAAHVEAESTPNGVGLVKVMGRNAGHIAMNATLASRDVDCCLIPEEEFYVDGKGGLFEFVEMRLRENGHCVILVAEGAGQHLIGMDKNIDSHDASGNRLLQDIGLWLSATLKDRWEKASKREPLNLKYIDPTYMVRAVPSNAADTIYCTLLAHNAIHGAMAGLTGFITGPVNGKYSYIPMQLVVDETSKVNVQTFAWAWVRSVNNQPDFSRRGQSSAVPRSKSSATGAETKTSINVRPSIN